MNIFPIVLICRNSDAAPASFIANVRCTIEQHNEVEYLEALCEKAEEMGYIVDNEIPIVVNSGDPLWEAFGYVYDDNDWKQAPLISLPSK